MQALLDSELKDRHLDSLRRYFAEKVRAQIVEEWIADNVASGSDFEKDRLKRDIEFSLRDGHEVDLRAYLSDVLEFGLRKADKKRRRKQWGDGGYIGHAWVALQGIARLAIVIGIFSAAQTKFESIVFASLVLIYELVSNAVSGQAITASLFRLEMENHFKRVRRLLKEEVSLTDDEVQYEQKDKNFRDLNRNGMRFWITVGFSAVIWLIAIWKLTTAAFL